MRARAVIGASYGDEGKGRTADWLAAPHGPAALVVRSNGGAQAGHSVELPGNLRHVFHHFGSGTLRGARTHLSQFMVSHPIVFADELENLRRIGMTPICSADPRGFVTTPWDMMVNQAVELAREGSRHGTCGLGFGETVGRCEIAPFALRVADLYRPALRDKLLLIRDKWLPQRLRELQLPGTAAPLAFAGSDQLLDRFIAQCEVFARQVSMRPDADIGSEQTIIFEGAQGLLLDQNAAGFPHLTRSNTGLANIAAVAAEAEMTGVDPVYVTRCYLTRHGRGPMNDERCIAQWYAVADPTNQPNPWQESLRFGLLDPAELGARIRADRAQAGIQGCGALAVTCLDQARGRLFWLERGEVQEGNQAEFLRALEVATGLPIIAKFSAPANDLPAPTYSTGRTVPCVGELSPMLSGSACPRGARTAG
jgi:adenylosuccinate synthase